MTKSQPLVNPSESAPDKEGAPTIKRKRKSGRLPPLRERGDLRMPDLEDFAPEAYLTKKDLDWLL